MVSSLSCTLGNSFLQSLFYLSQPHLKPFLLSILPAICAPLSKNTKNNTLRKLKRESPPGWTSSALLSVISNVACLSEE